MKKKRSVFAGSYEKCKELYAISLFEGSFVRPFVHLPIQSEISIQRIQSDPDGKVVSDVLFSFL